MAGSGLVVGVSSAFGAKSLQMSVWVNVDVWGYCRESHGQDGVERRRAFLFTVLEGADGAGEGEKAAAGPQCAGRRAPPRSLSSSPQPWVLKAAFPGGCLNKTRELVVYVNVSDNL